MKIIFETHRLLLAQFEKTDAALIFNLNSNPEIIKYVHEPVLKTIADASKILTDIILPQYERGLGRWAIYTKDKKEFIGWCGLKYIAELDEIDLGYRLMQHWWGKGYATEAARQSLDYGFSNLQLDIIYGRAHIENTVSVKVLEKIGMQFIQEEIQDGSPVRKYQAAQTGNQ